MAINHILQDESVTAGVMPYLSTYLERSKKLKMSERKSHDVRILTTNSLYSIQGPCLSTGGLCTKLDKVGASQIVDRVPGTPTTGPKPAPLPTLAGNSHLNPKSVETISFVDVAEGLVGTEFWKATASSSLIQTTQRIAMAASQVLRSTSKAYGRGTFRNWRAFLPSQCNTAEFKVLFLVLLLIVLIGLNILLLTPLAVTPNLDTPTEETGRSNKHAHIFGQFYDLCRGIHVQHIFVAPANTQTIGERLSTNNHAIRVLDVYKTHRSQGNAMQISKLYSNEQTDIFSMFSMLSIANEPRRGHLEPPNHNHMHTASGKSK